MRVNTRYINSTTGISLSPLFLLEQQIGGGGVGVGGGGEEMKGFVLVEFAHYEVSGLE